MSTSNELYNEADQLKEAGDLEGAAAKLKELVAADAEHALSHAALAIILGRLGQHEEAIEHSKKVSELEPDDAFSHTQLSVIYQRAYAGTNNQSYIQLAEDAMARSQMVQGRG